MIIRWIFDVPSKIVKIFGYAHWHAVWGTGAPPMPLLAPRSIDRGQDDIRFLAREAGAKTADDVLRIAERVIGSNRLLPKAQFIVQEMFPADPAESPPL